MAAGVPLKISMESAEADYNTTSGQRLLKSDLSKIYRLLCADGVDAKYINVSTVSKITKTQHSSTYTPEVLSRSVGYTGGGRAYTVHYAPELVSYTSSYEGV